MIAIAACAIFISIVGATLFSGIAVVALLLAEKI
jgi:hypothetical protein